MQVSDGVEYVKCGWPCINTIIQVEMVAFYWRDGNADRPRKTEKRNGRQSLW